MVMIRSTSSRCLPQSLCLLADRYPIINFSCLVSDIPGKWHKKQSTAINVRLVASGKWTGFFLFLWTRTPQLHFIVRLLKVYNICLVFFKLQFVKNRVLYFSSPHHIRHKLLYISITGYAGIVAITTKKISFFDHMDSQTWIQASILTK